MFNQKDSFNGKDCLRGLIYVWVGLHVDLLKLVLRRFGPEDDSQGYLRLRRDSLVGL